MNKKTLFVILAILAIPVLIFWAVTSSKQESVVAQTTGKPQIIKFSSTMCLECKQVEEVFKELIPKYQDKVDYYEVIVDSRDDMKNRLIEQYHVTLVPTIIMLNSDGSQYKRIESALPKKQMENYIKGLK